MMTQWAKMKKTTSISVQSSTTSDSIDARLKTDWLLAGTAQLLKLARTASLSRRGSRISQGRCPIHLNGAPEVERRRSNIFPAFYIFKDRR